MADVDKNIIFSPGWCGQLALGILSKTYAQVPFWVYMLNKNIKKAAKIQKCQKLTLKTKNVIIIKYHFV